MEGNWGWVIQNSLLKLWLIPPWVHCVYLLAVYVVSWLACTPNLERRLSMSYILIYETQFQTFTTCHHSFFVTTFHDLFCFALFVGIPLTSCFVYNFTSSLLILGCVSFWSTSLSTSGTAVQRKYFWLKFRIWYCKSFTLAISFKIWRENVHGLLWVRSWFLLIIFSYFDRKSYHQMNVEFEIKINTM